MNRQLNRCSIRCLIVENIAISYTRRSPLFLFVDFRNVRETSFHAGNELVVARRNYSLQMHRRVIRHLIRAATRFDSIRRPDHAE